LVESPPGEYTPVPHLWQWSFLRWIEFVSE